MRAQDIMTTSPACCTPDNTAQEAARMMEEHHCGCIPVVEDQESKRLVGVVTDRDLTIRGIARGMSPNTLVIDLMSLDVSCCRPHAEVQEVETIMAERQVRRVPIIDDRGCCIGMVAQADLAREEGHATTEEEVGRVVERISEKTNDARAEVEVGIVL